MSPVFGRQSTIQGYRRVLIIATSIAMVACVLYTAARNNVEVFLSQILLGIGSATLGVTRGYVADKTTKEQRTYLLAYTA